MDPIYWIVIILTVLIGGGGVFAAIWYGELRKRKQPGSSGE